MKIIGIAVAGFTLVAATFVVWLVFFSGPPIDIEVGNNTVRISTQFMGEYYVAAESVEVADADGTPVLLLTSDTGQCASFFYELFPGENDLSGKLSEHCHIVVPNDGASFVLKPAAEYRFTIVGDNGFAHTRKSSRRFTTPNARAQMAN